MEGKVNNNGASTDPDNGHVTPQNGQYNEMDMLRAATLVQDAQAGRHMTYKTDDKSIRSYLFYNSFIFKFILYICLWTLLFLPIFERPALIDPGDKEPVVISAEVVIIVVLLVRFFHNLYFDTPSTFWRDPKNITVFITLLLFILDIISYEIWSKYSQDSAIRWSRVLRPLLLINYPEGRELRKALRNIRRTIPDIVPVITLFMGSIAIFALVSMKLLQDRELYYPDGRDYFDNFFEVFWDLYVLVTTANSPDVMLPAYDKNRWFALFFMAYLIINLFIFMSIVLAVVYNNYKRHLKNEVILNMEAKKDKLSSAFNFLKTWHCTDGRYVITVDTWHDLMIHVDPKRDKTQRELMMYVLDQNANSYIEHSSFLKLSDLLNITISQINSDVTVLEKLFPSVYNSAISCYVRYGAQHKYFRYFFDFAIVVNAICIGLNIEESEWSFVLLFTLEICIKLYAGVAKFFRSAWNLFDFIVIIAALLGLILKSTTSMSLTYTEVVDFILVLRVLRLVRLVNTFKRFQVILSTLLNIGPSILTYGGLIFILYYVYAIIGMELFHGKIQYYGYENVTEVEEMCGNSLLNGSEFVERRYCSNNFNSITQAFVVLFTLMVVDQWHVVASGFVKVTHVSTRLYFFSFHVLCVLLLLDLFTAFVLEVFLLEYDFGQTELECTIEYQIRAMGLSEGQIPIPRQVRSDKVPIVDEMEDVEADLPEVDLSAEGNKSSGVRDAPPGVQENSGLRFKIRKRWKKRVEILLEHDLSQETLNKNQTAEVGTPETSGTTQDASEITIPPASVSHVHLQSDEDSRV